jgi:hypothetical protein
MHKDVVFMCKEQQIDNLALAKTYSCNSAFYQSVQRRWLSQFKDINKARSELDRKTVKCLMN